MMFSDTQNFKIFIKLEFLAFSFYGCCAFSFIKDIYIYIFTLEVMFFFHLLVLSSKFLSFAFHSCVFDSSGIFLASFCFPY